MQSDLRHRVLLFSPFTEIWPHALSEAQLVGQLPTDRFEVTILNCGQLFPRFCTVMEFRGLPLVGQGARKVSVCKDCTVAARLIARDASSESVPAFLADFAEPEDELFVTQALSAVTRDNFLEFNFHELELGRIASYESLIKYKKVSLILRNEEWEYLFETLKNCMRTVITAERYLAIHAPDSVLCYSPQYGVTGAFAALAISRNIKTYFVEGSANLAEKYSAVRVWDWHTYMLVNPALDHWRDGDDVADPSDEELRRLASHFRTIDIAQAHDVYSNSRQGLSTRKSFDIGEDAQVLLLAMSSYDEVFSGATIGGYPLFRYLSDVYVDQVAWVNDTIEWARVHEHSYLIIRLHPRDFPNRRDNVHAEQAMEWEALFERLPTNVRVDYPVDKFPLGDHLDEIDVLITGWSSTALEAMARGIPVITYDANLPRFPPSIHHTGRTRSEYLANLEKSTALVRDPKTREAMLKWLAYTYCRGTIRVPGRLIDRKPLISNPVIRRGLMGLNKFLPFFTRKVDLELSGATPDVDTLSALLISGASSVYEL